MHMKRLLCPQIPKRGEPPTTLPPDEAKHAVQVLRLKTGDIVEIMDGRGGKALARLQISGKTVLVSFVETPQDVLQKSPSQVLPVSLALSILKGDAMEWTIEKAVELGVREITPLMSTHSVVDLKKKGAQAFQERWQRIADQSLKQCGRLHKLTVNLPISIPIFLKEQSSENQVKKEESKTLWFDEAGKDETPPLGSYLLETGSSLCAATLMIGPEGGWSDTERQLMASSTVRLSLGPLVLRAETAAVFSMSLLTSHFRTLTTIPRKSEMERGE